MPKLLLILPLAAIAFFVGRSLNRPTTPPKSVSAPASIQPSQPLPSAPSSKEIPTLSQSLAARGTHAVTLLARFLPHATAADLHHLATTADAADESMRYPDAWWHLLGHHWFKLDPTAATAFTIAPDRSFIRRPQMLAAWASVDPEAALAAASKFGTRQVVSLLHNLAYTDPDQAATLGAPHVSAGEIDRIIRESRQHPDPDPASALAAALEITAAPERIKKIKTVFSQAAKDDPHAALALAQSIASPGERSAAIGAITRSLARNWNDPALFRSLHHTLPASRDRSQITVAAAKKWGAENRDQALAWANASLAGPERDAAIAAVIHASQGDNKTAVLDYLDSQGWNVDLQNSTQGNSVKRPGGGGGGSSWGAESYKSLLYKAFTHLAESSPTDALQRLADVPDPDVRDRLLGNVATQWFADDPAAAAGWLAGIPASYTGPALRNTIEEGMKNWAAEDRDGARRYLSSTTFANPEIQRSAITNAINTDLTDPDQSAAAMAWLQTLPAATRGELAPDLVDELARESPTVAAELAVALGAEHLSEYQIRQLSSGLFEDGPTASSAWLDRLPPGAKSGQAYQTLASQWAHVSPQQSSAWVNSLAAGDMKDQAINGLALALVAPSGDTPPDFESALLWSSSISADSTRTSSLDAVVKSWVQKDAAGLAAYIAANPDLNPTAHQAIQKALGQ